MRLKLTCLLTTSLLIVLLIPGAVSAQDFSPALNAIDKLGPGETDKIQIAVTDENFNISLNDDVAGPKSLGTFPLSQWPAFIDAAVKHGLRGYSRYNSYDQDQIALNFVSSQRTKVSTGSGDLNLPRVFFDYMETVEEFPAQQGKNGFAILIYDPHSSIQGRYQLVPALNDLISSNSTRRFKLLDEGEYEGSDRIVSFNGLDQALKKLPSGPTAFNLKPSIVYSLLERYLIDSAMAYRLLYDEKIAEIAIDDNPSLADDERILKGYFGERFDAFSYSDNIHEIRSKVEAFLKRRQGVTPRRRTLANAVIAAISEYEFPSQYWGLTSRARAASYQNRAAQRGKIVEAARQLQLAAPTARLQVEISALSGEDPYKFQSALAQNYARRETVMAEQIINEARFTSGSVPIAFLGDVHFYGITEDLRNQGIGYVVFAPLDLYSPNQDDEDNFKRFVTPATRADYLKQTTRSNKGPVGLTAEQIASFISPFIQDSAAKFQSQKLAERTSFSSSPEYTIDYDKVSQAASANRLLAQAKIGIETPTTVDAAAGDNIPPRAIAYFELGENGQRPRLVMLDPKGEGWRGPAGQMRYDMLQNVPVGYRELVKGFNFYNLSNGQSAAIFYDSVKGRAYLIDGSLTQMSDVITIKPNSRPKGSSNTRVRLFVGEVIRKQERTLTNHGE